MKTQYTLILAAAMLAGLTAFWVHEHHARADDLDQHCLAMCKSAGGQSSAGCLSECTYNVTPTGTAAPKASPYGASHDVFKAPVPAGDLVIGTTHAAPESSKDYQCVHECLQNGGQYQICNDHCTRISCATGSPNCTNDTRGIISPYAYPGVNVNSASIGSSKPRSPNAITAPSSPSFPN